MEIASSCKFANRTLCNCTWNAKSIVPAPRCKPIFISRSWLQIKMHFSGQESTSMLLSSVRHVRDFEASKVHENKGSIKTPVV